MFLLSQGGIFRFREICPTKTRTNLNPSLSGATEHQDPLVGSSVRLTNLVVVVVVVVVVVSG